ncbi:MAG: nitroreductase family deazaflavin-dependent oxidoreductase [Pseudomonadales bacterium]|nr:nitroreductase family deazaflavin-dependent oxidoreductase [Pseudomonadales bacterium]
MTNTMTQSLPGWIADHLKRYIESDGEDGHLWDASLGGGQGMVTTLLLTTTGRKSGTAHTLPLIYGEADGNYIIIASKGGAPAHPAWYLNLEANPEVGVQVVAQKFQATARVATGEERTRLWRQLAGIYSPYDAYQKLAQNREIPVVVLEPKK